METLYTKRLVLRPFKTEDAQAIYKNWTSDPRVAKYCTWYPHNSVEDTKMYVDMCMKKNYCWAITLKGSDEPVGAIDVVGVTDDGAAHIGYVLMQSQWGKGVMTEAAKTVIAELFAQGFKVVGACHHPDNPASGRVMQKCGMTYVGNSMQNRKFDSEELCEVKIYEIQK